MRPDIPPPRQSRHHIVAAEAAPPVDPPRPFGDLATATPAELIELMLTLWPYSVATSWRQRRGMLDVLGHLAQAGGGTWQERWVASGLDETGRPVRDEISGYQTDMSRAVMVLFCLRVIRPSLGAFRSNRFVAYDSFFRVAQHDPAFDRFVEAVDALDKSPHWKKIARFDVACALTTQGIAFGGLTAEAFLHYAVETRAGGFTLYSGSKYAGHLAWEVLHAIGQFRPATPSTLRAVLRAPARTCEQLVDQYQIIDPGVRQLLIDYLQRRSYDVDHSSLKGLATVLWLTFWAQVQRINPDQHDLNLSEATYQTWRASLEIRPDGQPRRDQLTVLAAVRALYLDLQGWAAAEPELWSQWVAPCLIGNRDMRGYTKNRRRVKEHMDGRTRTLQPLLATLLRVVEDNHRHLAELLPAAIAAEPGDVITCGTRIYRRIHTGGDVAREQRHGGSIVRVQVEGTGRAINVKLAEDKAFWLWACVHTLRLSGVRNEELLELSQLSIRQYVRSNGEVVALLVIAPSKTDRERVIPMSAELFHVIASIVRRLTADNGTVPLATRYDKGENITSEPLPFLFQRTLSQRVEVITPSGLRAMLAEVCQQLAADHPELNTCRFTPHDFRRLLATELANSGLPIHIGAALLGHLNLQTFHGYVTVFNEDIVRHYQTHLARRRDARPAIEYRPVNDQEWQEFEEHFDKRKVELGNCGRPYGSPCDHEHSCIRCPMLRIDPAMIGRLTEIETDLISRRTRAVERGWLGEIEGIELTLRFLRDKRNEATRLAQNPPVTRGIPARGSGSSRPPC